MEDRALKVDGSSGDSALEADIADGLKEYFELWKRKQHDYGPGNIAAFGEFGCLVRAFDKVNRLRSLLGKKNAVDGEPLRDAWLDLIGYAICGLACHDGRWPGVSNKEVSIER